MGNEKMYHYTECGLDSVHLKNGYRIEDGAHGKGVSIHDIDGLHETIARGIIAKESHLTPKEFRFLRHELDLSQSSLGRIMEKTDQTVAKWEKGEVNIPVLADKAIRDLYLNNLGESQTASILNKLAELDRALHETKLDIERLETEHLWRLSEDLVNCG